MIEILELRALRGPNRYTRHTSIFMVLDIQEYEQLPSNIIEGFTKRLLDLMPTLQDHGCSVGGRGGFVKRLDEGTWAGHIIEHIAIELQCLAGMEIGYGKTFTTSVEGTYVVVFRYRIESAGLMAAKEAVSLFRSVAENNDYDIESAISELKILKEQDMLGPTTYSIVKEAKLRGIPSVRLNENNYIQLGYGASQKRIQASMTSQTSAIAVEVADEKSRVKENLKKIGIAVPNGYLVHSEEEAVEAFSKLDGAVVVKPDVGNHGKGATVNIIDVDQVRLAYREALKRHSEVVVEDYIKGHDYRLLVIDGKFVAAAKRKPACVVGDGSSSIQELIDIMNSDAKRGFGHEKPLTKVVVDEMTQRALFLNKLSLDDKPSLGQVVHLKNTANLSQGGTSEDVTDKVSTSIRLMVERAVVNIGLDCAGVDVLAKDISLSLMESELKVIEINAAPGFRMHLEPTVGQPRNVAKPVVDMLFPSSYEQVPIVAVTGTNGKTTTCKLIAHTLKYASQKVGLACTTGVEVDGVPILHGDYSGPEGANIIIRQPLVDSIVLEVARGGLVRRGLGVNKVDIGVLLNIGSDHVGTDWVESHDDLRLVKSTVIEAVKPLGASVINADDAGAMSVLDRARGTVILFTVSSQNLNFIRHIKDGGTGVILKEDNITIIFDKNNEICVCAIRDVPITLSGIIGFNISNALAAVGAMYGMGIPIEKIRNGIMTFYSSPNQNPGRMNLFDFKEYKVLVDYGHNPDAVRAMSKFLPKISKGRKIGLCHGTGTRTDDQLIKYGEALAIVYDYIVLTDFDQRDRSAGETIKLIEKGLIRGGFKRKQIEVFIDSSESTLDYFLSKAKIGDLLVFQIDEIEPILTQIKKRYLEKINSYL